MKQTWRKIAVTFIAILTLGLYIPPIDTTDIDQQKGTDVSHADSATTQVHAEEADDAVETYDDIQVEETDIASILMEKAKEQTYIKLGPRIASQLEDEFHSIILPKIEEKLEMILADVTEDELVYYEITENPSDGYGERIFNVRDHETKKDIAKFHVRREHRPMDGYWFNFHYHLLTDGFAEHHEIGDIFWDKNMPPKWMS